MSEPTVVGAGVDSLYLGYRVRPKWSVIGELEAMKLRAGASRRAPTDPRTGEVLAEVPESRIHLGGIDLDVRPYGASSAPYLLHAEDLVQVAVHPEPSGGAPSVQVKVLASALWREGTPAMVALADAIALSVGDVREQFEDEPLDAWRYVQRIDVAVDFQGWTPVVSDFELFSAKGGPTMELHPVDAIEETLEAPRMWRRWNLSGFRFGKSSVVVRLYDKVAEVLVSGKHWFRSVWSRSPNYLVDGPVWRLEVQLPRSYLKTVRNEGGELLETVEDVLAHLAPLWRTVLGEKLRLTNGDATRLTNATTREEWAALEATTEIDGALDGSKVTRLEQDTVTADALVTTLRGYLGKYGALKKLDSLDDVLVDVGERVADVCTDREEPFHELVAKKRAARVVAEAARQAADMRAAETRAARARGHKEAIAGTFRLPARSYPCIRWARRSRVPVEQLAFDYDGPRRPRQLSFGGGTWQG